MTAHKLFCSSLFFVFWMKSLLLSQVTFERTYGGIYYDSGTSIVETADQGFVIMATANSFSNDINAAYVIRTDATGDTLWTKVISGEGLNSGIDIQHASDGGYVLAIASSSINPSNGYDIYLVKIDDAGNTLWSKAYGGPELDYVHSFTKTKDGGYAMLAHTHSFGNGGSDFYLVRVDQAGDTLWTKTYGGSEWDWGSSVQQTEDGGFILVGDTESFGDLNGDLYLIKTDSSGYVQWQKTYGGPEHDRGYYVIQMDDTGYMVVGRTESYGTGSTDCYVIRTDANGDSLWTKTFGGIDSDAAQAVQQISDGNFVFIGSVSTIGYGKSDAYLVKFTPDGNVLWEKFYGGAEHDGGRHIIETTDSGFAFVGSSESFIAGNEGDIYLVKTDGNGNVTSVSSENSNSHPEAYSLHQNYPNPFNPETKIQYNLSNSGNITLKIFNLMGQEVRTLVDEFKHTGTFQISWDGKNEYGQRVASGVYLYRLRVEKTFTQTRKMLLLQ